MLIQRAILALAIGIAAVLLGVFVVADVLPRVGIHFPPEQHEQSQ